MRIKIVDMNSYRRATRDLLLEYDTAIMPPRPHTAGLSSVYPWEQANLSILSKQLYTLAANSGYSGTQQDFNTHFGSYLESNQQEIMFSTYPNFPQIGQQNILYFDLDEKILYYWDGEYIPVNTMIITDTMLNGGEA